MPCKFCNVLLVNPDHAYFSRFAENQNGTVTFMNIGRLSNDDGESNKDVSIYQNECTFFKRLFGVWDMGPHPISSSDSEKKLNVSLC